MLNHADKYSQTFHLHEFTTKKGYKGVSYEEYIKNKHKYENSALYSSFWYKDFDGMAFKTLLRQLISKWGIMSIDMQEAYKKDMATIKEDGSYEYVDNQDNDTDAVVKEQEINIEAEHNNQQKEMANQEQMEQMGLDLSEGF